MGLKMGIFIIIIVLILIIVISTVSESRSKHGNAGRAYYNESENKFDKSSFKPENDKNKFPGGAHNGNFRGFNDSTGGGYTRSTAGGFGNNNPDGFNNYTSWGIPPGWAHNNLGGRYHGTAGPGQDFFNGAGYTSYTPGGFARYTSCGYSSHTGGPNNPNTNRRFYGYGGGTNFSSNGGFGNFATGGQHNFNTGNTRGNSSGAYYGYTRGSQNYNTNGSYSSYNTGANSSHTKGENKYRESRNAYRATEDTANSRENVLQKLFPVRAEINAARKILKDFKNGNSNISLQRQVIVNKFSNINETKALKYRLFPIPKTKKQVIFFAEIDFTPDCVILNTLQNIIFKGILQMDVKCMELEKLLFSLIEFSNVNYKIDNKQRILAEFDRLLKLEIKKKSTPELLKILNLSS